MSEYIDILGSEIVVKDSIVDKFIDAWNSGKNKKFSETFEVGEDGTRIDCLIGIFDQGDFELTQSIEDTKDGEIHCFQWMNEDGSFRSYHDDFFEFIAPFVEGHVDYLHNGTPYRHIFEDGKQHIETGEVRFPSSDRW